MTDENVQPSEQEKEANEIPAVEFVPPSDGSWIPRERFDQATGKLKEELQTEREARIRAETKAEAPKEKRYTRTDLLGMVDEGQLTQAQADEAWEQQLRKDIRDEINKEFDSKLTAKDQASRVSEELRKYKQAVPDLMSESENRLKVENEFSYLISLGQPNTSATELAALRAVFGPVDKLNKPKPTYETPQETFSGNQPETKSSLKLTDREKQYYGKMIDEGVYKNWDEIKEMIDHVKKRKAR